MESAMHKRNGPIAIVGISALFPGSTDNEGFWQDIMAGRDLITDVPATHWLTEDYYDPDPAVPDKTYANRGAFLSAIDFDPLEFAIPPSNLASTDTSQLLALAVAKQVLEDAAQGQFSKLDKDRISVILGSSGSTELTVELGSRVQRPVWVKSLRESGLPEDQVQEISERIASHYSAWNESSFPGMLGNVIAGRIANHFNFGGTNCVVDAACASSLSALSMGIMELHTGKSDLVITGGVDTLNNITTFMSFSKTPALSPTGDCRPFSDQADGTMLGEGLCMLALRRLEDAERDGDRIYAVLRGCGSSSDGKSKSVYAPVSKGQAKALRRTYEIAGYGPETVELMEAHGTGTKAGDAAEFEGLRLVFEESGQEARQWCALGSVKSQIGHTKGTAGAAGLFKAVMALHHKAFPPTIKVDQPNPKLKLQESPFYLNTRTRPWIRGSEHPRRASVSAFGFGGSNFHATLEEYIGPGKHAWRLRNMPSELIVLGGESKEQLAALCGSLAVDLDSSKLTLAGAAQYTQIGVKTAGSYRLAIVASSEAELKEKLQLSIELIRGRADSTGMLPARGIYYACVAQPGLIGFLFPGQGSQYVGMGEALALEFDAAREVWDAAADLSFGNNGKLHEIVFPRPVFSDEARLELERRLKATEWAQPTIGAMSLSALRVLQAVGIEPDLLGGHSFGEITALCAAGALDERTMLNIARKRGELMAEASSEAGAMTAVLHPRARMEWVASEAAACGLTAANRNSPEQTVVSGREAAIVSFESRLAREGIRFARLPVATAFHSPLVEASVEPFRGYLQQCVLKEPAIPVVSNKDAADYPLQAAAIGEQLAQQIAKPVRFMEQVEAMFARGVRTFVEVGPGHALTNLVGQILGDRPHLAVAMDRKGQNGLTSLWHALAQLFVNGASIDFQPFWAAYAPLKENEPSSGRSFTLPINGANYGKPYPPEGGAAALPKPNAPAAKELPPSIPQNIHSDIDAMPLPESYPSHTAHQEAVMTNSSLYHPELLAIIAENQRQMAEAHSAYQNAMVQSHMAFLKTTEVFMQSISSMMGGGLQLGGITPGSVPQGSTLRAEASALPMQAGYTVPAPRPVLEPVFASPMPAQQPMAPAPRPAVPAIAMATPPQLAQAGGARMTPPPAAYAALAQVAPASAPVRVASPAPAATAVAVLPTPPTPSGKQDLHGLMLSIVAEKTGYPVEMLDMETELESGFGIDSIKRVEILSAIQASIPEMPEVQPGEMAVLQSLGEIAAYINGLLGGNGTAGQPAQAITAGTGSGTYTVEQLQATMLAIVAEKTGYPEEMLDMETELESGFGIDSIKRVEILSAVQERCPGLPEIQPGEMAVLATLGEIVSYLSERMEESSRKN